jgi:hypothetical protein
MVLSGCEFGRQGSPTGPSEPPVLIGNDGVGFYYYDSEVGEFRNIASLPLEDNILIHADFTDPAYQWQIVDSVYWVYTQNWHEMLLATDNVYQAPYDSIYIGIYGNYYPLTRLKTSLTGNRYKFRIIVQNGVYVVENWATGNPYYKLTFYRITPDSSDYWNGSFLNFDGLSMNKKWPTQVKVEGGSVNCLNMLDLSGTVLPLDTLSFAISYDLGGVSIDTLQLVTQYNGMYQFYIDIFGVLWTDGDSVLIPINPGGP